MVLQVIYGLSLLRIVCVELSYCMVWKCMDVCWLMCLEPLDYSCSISRMLTRTALDSEWLLLLSRCGSFLLCRCIDMPLVISLEVRNLP